MNATQPGWYPDPFGRFAQRYHDGRRWTEHVADAAGQQSNDGAPLATSPVGTTGTGEPGSSPGTSTWQAPLAGGTSFGDPQSGSTSTGSPPFAPPSGSAWGGPTTASGGTAVLPTTPAPAAAREPARGGAGRWIGAVLAVIGALLVVLGLFALDWIDKTDRQGTADFLEAIVDDRNANPNILSETWFRWGWIVTLVIAGLALVAAFTAVRVLRIVAAVLALLAALWTLFGWLNFHAYVNNDTNNEVLRSFSDISENPSADIGGWLTVAGLVLLAIGALIGGPLGRRRPSPAPDAAYRPGGY